jgi:hypothetical protein
MPRYVPTKIHWVLHSIFASYHLHVFFDFSVPLPISMFVSIRAPAFESSLRFFLHRVGEGDILFSCTMNYFLHLHRFRHSIDLPQGASPPPACLFSFCDLGQGFQALSIAVILAIVSVMS